MICCTVKATKILNSDFTPSFTVYLFKLIELY